VFLIGEDQSEIALFDLTLFTVFPYHNGACGGARNGKCEMDPEKDCAWELIFQRLERQDKLDLLREFRTPRNYQAKVWRLTP